MLVPSASRTPQSGGFCPDWPLGWGVWRPQNRRGLEPWCGHGKGQGAWGEDRVRALAVDRRKCWTKTRNNKCHTLKFLKSQEGPEE